MNHHLCCFHKQIRNICYNGELAAPNALKPTQLLQAGGPPMQHTRSGQRAKCVRLVKKETAAGAKSQFFIPWLRSLTMAHFVAMLTAFFKTEEQGAQWAWSKLQKSFSASLRHTYHAAMTGNQEHVMLQYRTASLIFLPLSYPPGERASEHERIMPKALFPAWPKVAHT